jgi:hypothetical protein
MPREYNFKTDVLDFDLEVDKRALGKVVAELFGNVEFNTWLHDNFASRSGFWSYTPDNYPDLAVSIVHHGDDQDQAMGALVQWLCRGSRDQNGELEKSEYMAYETWSCNGYMGLDYWIECAECNGHMDYDMDGEYHCTNESCTVNKHDIETK